MKASCHCGAVELRLDLSGPLEAPHRCTCSYCRRRAVPTVSVPLARLHVVKGAEALTLYTWGTGTAQHYFCKICGIYTHHRRRSDPSQYGVNFGCIAGMSPADHEPIAWLDGVNHPADR